MSEIPERLHRKRPPRVATVRLRTPWLYPTDVDRYPQPGDTAVLTLEHLRRCRKAVIGAQRDGRLTYEDARVELEQIDLGIKTIRESKKFDNVGGYFPMEGCIPPEPVIDRAARRKKGKAQRQARKANRPKKRRRR